LRAHGVVSAAFEAGAAAKGFCPSPQSKEDAMSSIFTHLRDYGYDTAVRTLVVLSFAVVLYVILEGWLW
jgi:hypothetical protein